MSKAHLATTLMRLSQQPHSRPFIAALAGVALCIGAAVTRADTAQDPLNDRFSVSVGTFLMTTDTTVRVDGAGGRGTEFDVEENLGFDDTDSLRVEGYWRFGRRHKLRLLYFDNTRSESRNIQRQIDFRGTTYPVDVTIGAEFETQVMELAYSYAFLQRDRYELAGSIGVHNITFDLRLSAVGTGAGGVSSDQSAELNGPLPVLGLSFVWLIAPDWHLDAQAQFFRFSLDPYSGRLDDYTVSLVWMPWDRVGIGIGYNQFITRMDVEDDDFNGRLEWDYGGARAFVRFSF